MALLLELVELAWDNEPPLLEDVGCAREIAWCREGRIAARTTHVLYWFAQGGAAHNMVQDAAHELYQA